MQNEKGGGAGMRCSIIKLLQLGNIRCNIKAAAKGVLCNTLCCQDNSSNGLVLFLTS